MKTLCRALLIGALAVVATGPAQAQSKKDSVKPEMPYETASRLLGIPMQEGEEPNYPDHNATKEALRALLAASNAEIPVSSSCQEHHGQTGKATVKDMLASVLTYMYPGGKNMILGNCQFGQCAVRIAHDGGEDIASATIVFDKVQGKASVPTLQCVLL